MGAVSRYGGINGGDASCGVRYVGGFSGDGYLFEPMRQLSSPDVAAASSICESILKLIAILAGTRIC